MPTPAAPDMPADVRAVFDGYPIAIRSKMLALRDLILATARESDSIGPLEEALKWGEPAYLTPSGAGTTVRIDWKPTQPEYCALYLNCRTSLIAEFRDQFTSPFLFQGNRALLFQADAPMPAQELAVCIHAALTYRLRGKRRSRA